MSFYKRVIFPRLCDVLLNRTHVAEQRRELLKDARGEILEIGLGTGLNLPYYPKDVSKITAVEPNAGMNSLARRRMRQTGLEVDVLALNSERLPFESGTFDTLVSTLTLCSIVNVEQALQEVYRVLKTGGKFLFLEHGLSPDRNVQKWQQRLNWLEMSWADGCRLDRDIPAIVAAEPFSSMSVEQFYLRAFPKTHGYVSRGVAEK